MERSAAQGHSTRGWRRLSVLGVGIGVATVVMYVWLLTTQPEMNGSRTWMWLGAMALPSVLATAAVFSAHGALTKALLLVSGMIFVGVGLPSVLSVGVGFLAAGTLQVMALLSHPGSSQPTSRDSASEAMPRRSSSRGM